MWQKKEGEMLNWVSKKGFTEEATLEKRVEGNEERTHVESVGIVFPT